MKRFALLVVCLFIVAPAALPAAAAELDTRVDIAAGPFFAIPKLGELPPAFDGAVILVAPYKGGHVGLALNRPTQVMLGEIFPDDAASQNVREPVYLGGGAQPMAVVALARSSAQPSPEALELASGLWLVFEARAIDRILAERPNEARYFMGFIQWRPGFAAHAIAAGVLTVRPVDPAKVLLPDTSGLRRELMPDEPAPLDAGARQNRL